MPSMCAHQPTRSYGKGAQQALRIPGVLWGGSEVGSRRSNQSSQAVAKSSRLCDINLVTDATDPSSLGDTDNRDSAEPDRWQPGPGHWRATTAIAVVSALVAAASATAAVVTATRPTPAPRVVAEVNMPTISGNPGVSTSDQVRPECTDDRSKALVGWGPPRPIYGEEGSPHIGFNSIKSNPIFGDERAFFNARESSSNDLWEHKITVVPGKLYSLRIYVHNGSTPSLSADNTLLKINLPTCAGNSIGSGAILSSNDSYPMEVWDGVTFQSDSLFNLTYVEDSATLYGNSLGKDGMKISGTDFLTSKGMPIGTKGLDGKIHGGYENAMYFTFLVRPQFAS